MSTVVERGATTDAVILGLNPIGLDELLQRATLLTRLDRKYVLPTTDLSAVLAGLTGDVQALEIDGRREFSYQSLYFDTPDLASYRATAHRRRRRFKLRIRSYVDSDQHFLEVKIRGQRGTTVKQRIPYAGDSIRPSESLGSEAKSYVDAVLSAAGIPVSRLHFDPVLITRYQRTTLFLPSTGSRVTIDRDLSWGLPGDAAVRSLDRAIVETKSDSGVSAVDRLLWSLRHRPCSVSKYATGLAALRPDLPANHWTPVLRRHFHTLTNSQTTAKAGPK
jgi:hypothetical protein